jgi:hypothetical protein
MLPSHRLMNLLSVMCESLLVGKYAHLPSIVGRTSDDQDYRRVRSASWFHYLALVVSLNPDIFRSDVSDD